MVRDIGPGVEGNPACRGELPELIGDMSAAEILKQLRLLPERERRAIAEQILEETAYLENEPSAEQIEEMERRADWLRRHPEAGIPWEQVRAELKERLKRRACDAK